MNVQLPSHIFICMVPMLSPEVDKRNYDIFPYVEHINAELCALFGINDDFALRKLGLVILLDIAKLLGDEHQQSLHLPENLRLHF